MNKDASSDDDNELVEACLNTFESFIRKCPKEVSQYIKEMLSLVSVLLTYDPNYTYGENNNMEDDEEGGWGSDWEDNEQMADDDDDTSWKVRRASVKVIDAIIKTRPEMLRELYQSMVGNLIERFKERDENVKCDIFSTFCSLLRSTVVNESSSSSSESSGLELHMQGSISTSLVRMRSSTEELYNYVPLIIEEVLKQLKSKS